MNDDSYNTELNIRIDRLVLEGISLTSYEQQRLKESIETELSGMFFKNGIPSQMGATQITKCEPIQLRSQKPAPNEFGKQIAKSIYNGMASDQGSKIRE